MSNLTLMDKSAEVVRHGTVVSALDLIVWLVSFVLNQDIVWCASQISRTHHIAFIHHFGICIGSCWLNHIIVNTKFSMYSIYIVFFMSISIDLVWSIVLIRISLQVWGSPDGLGFSRVFAGMLATFPSFKWSSPFELLAVLKSVNCNVPSKQACISRSCHKDLYGGDIILIRPIRLTLIADRTKFVFSL